MKKSQVAPPKERKKKMSMLFNACVLTLFEMRFIHNNLAQQNAYTTIFIAKSYLKASTIDSNLFIHC